MAEKSKSDDIDPEKCIQYAVKKLGTAQTPFYTSLSLFALNTATLAQDFFLSRHDSDYICGVTSDEIQPRAQVIWAAALLSQVCQSSDVTYDDICDIATPEVAGYLPWILPDRTISFMEGTARILSQLSQRNTYSTCGPVFIVLARAVVAAKSVGDIDSFQQLRSQATTALPLRLWDIRNTLLQLKVAQVWKWSEFVGNSMKEALTITNTWPDNALYPDVRFRCGDIRHSVDWVLDMSVPSPGQRYKEFTIL